MIALVLVMQAAALLPGSIGRQALPAKGCAAFLWDRGSSPALVAMATADPATLRLSIDGKPVDLPRAGQGGDAAGYGFARRTEYRLATVTARLELTVTARPDLTQGAAITDATLTVERSGADSVVLPVGGLVGCAPSA